MSEQWRTVPGFEGGMTRPRHLAGHTYGLCTACGCAEVSLNQPTGTRDLSQYGESVAYPTGYGCEVCA